MQDTPAARAATLWTGYASRRRLDANYPETGASQAGSVMGVPVFPAGAMFGSLSAEVRPATGIGDPMQLYSRTRLPREIRRVLDGGGACPAGADAAFWSVVPDAPDEVGLTLRGMGRAAAMMDDYRP
ncbi:hypothetical protein [Acetobacter nitrogenifigens]|nr:hypothetical protein [Acetobacter nitrogenifigens]